LMKQFKYRHQARFNSNELSLTEACEPIDGLFGCWSDKG
jgi:hypothetical protein